MITEREMRSAVEVMARLLTDGRDDNGLQAIARRYLLEGMTPEHIEGVIIGLGAAYSAIRDEEDEWDGDDVVSTVICAIKGGKFSQSELRRGEGDWLEFAEEVSRL